MSSGEVAELVDTSLMEEISNEKKESEKFIEDIFIVYESNTR